MNNRHIQPCVLFLVLIPLVTFGQDREWTSRNGKFKLQATLLNFSDGTVELKRSDNGKTIEVELSRLCRADREFVASKYGSSNKTESVPELGDAAPPVMQTKPAETEPTKSKTGAKTTAKAIWEPTFVDGKQDHSMQLELVARGGESSTAMEYGMLRIESMSDNSGNSIAIKESDFSFDDLTKKFKKVDRDDKFFQKHPKNGVRLTVDIDADDTVKKIVDIKGSFKVRGGGTQDRMEIDNLSDKVGETMDIADGLTAEIVIEGSELRFELTGEHSKVFDVEALNKSGKKHPKSNGGGEGGGGNLHQYFFSFDGDVPNDVKLSVLTIEGLEESEIKFEIPNVKIPAKPKNNF